MFELNAGLVVYLHRDPVDFRKSVNGRVTIVDLPELDIVGRWVGNMGVLWIECGNRKTFVVTLYERREPSVGGLDGVDTR